MQSGNIFHVHATASVNLRSSRLATIERGIFKSIEDSKERGLNSERVKYLHQIHEQQRPFLRSEPRSKFTMHLSV